MSDKSIATHSTMGIAIVINIVINLFRARTAALARLLRDIKAGIVINEHAAGRAYRLHACALAWRPGPPSQGRRTKRSENIR